MTRVDLTGCSPTAKAVVKAAGGFVQRQSVQNVGAGLAATGLPARTLVRAGLHLLDAVGRVIDGRDREPGGPAMQIHIQPIQDPDLLAATGRAAGEIEGQVVAALQCLRQADPRGDAVGGLASEGLAAALVIAYMTAQMVEASDLDAFVEGVAALCREDLARVQPEW